MIVHFRFLCLYFLQNRNFKILDVIRPLNAALDQLATIVSAKLIMCAKNQWFLLLLLLLSRRLNAMWRITYRSM